MDKQTRYSSEVREQAVRLVQDHRHEHGSPWAAIQSIAAKVGCTAETLRRWGRQVERDDRRRSGLTTEDQQRVKALEREMRELRRTNEIPELSEPAADTNVKNATRNLKGDHGRCERMFRLAWTAPGIAALGIIAVACGSVTEAPILTTLSVSLSPATITVGENASASVAGRDQNGASIGTGAVIWSSSVLTVATISPSGVITAQGAGQTQIRATAGGISALAALTVTEAPVATVSVTPVWDTVFVGGGLQLTATLRSGTGNILSGRAVAWATSDSNIARVSTEGLVSGVSRGTVTISASSEGRLGANTLDVRTGGMLSPTGSTLVLLGGQVTIIAPDGAVSSPTKVVVDTLPSVPSDPRYVPGSAVDIRPNGLNFAVPVTVAMVYDPTSLPYHLESHAALGTVTGTTWATVPSSHADTLINRVSATLTHLSTYGVLGASPTEVSLDVRGGNAQSGASGFAAADSLSVRLADLDGHPAVGVPVSWAVGSGGGVIQPQISNTGLNGEAVAQLVMGPPGPQTATASVAGDKQVQFTGVSRLRASCSLDPGQTSVFREGPPDPLFAIRATGAVRAIMLFVDFVDAPNTETTLAASARVMPDAERYFDEVSYRAMTLTVTQGAQWLRMPLPSTSYSTVSYAGIKPYLQAAAQLAIGVDLSQYDFVIVVPSQGSAIDPLSSHAYVVAQGDGPVVRGVELRRAVVLGTHIYTLPFIAGFALAHETNHILGLPDLYNFTTGGIDFVGVWSIMSAYGGAGHVLAFEKYNLGWLPADGIACIEGGGVEVTVSATEVAGGLKAVAVRLDASRLIVAEVRQRLGFDATRCDVGVLLYVVDATVASGSGPIRLFSGAPSGHANSCTILDDATFDLSGGKLSHFLDPGSGTTVDLIGQSGGAYRIRVRKP